MSWEPKEAFGLLANAYARQSSRLRRLRDGRGGGGGALRKVATSWRDSDTQARRQLMINASFQLRVSRTPTGVRIDAARREKLVRKHERSLGWPPKAGQLSRPMPRTSGGKPSPRCVSAWLAADCHSHESNQTSVIVAVVPAYRFNNRNQAGFRTSGSGGGRQEKPACPTMNGPS
jgi:hypothetical protein